MSTTDGTIRTLTRTSTDGGTADGSTLAGDALPRTEPRAGGLTTVGTERIGSLPFPGPIVGLSPTINDALPRSGAPGTQVVILGSNFPVDGDLRFNGVQAFYVFSSTMRIETQVPQGASTGRITLNGVQSPFDFVVGAPSGAPTIAGFTPTAGRAGDFVSINGTNLDRVTEVRFNGVRADAPFIFSPQILQATVPQGATSGPLTVTGPSGSATSAQPFTVATGIPSITGFSPPAGAPGQQVDIFGTELGGANRVTFNGADAQFSVISNTQVRAAVPGFVGNGPIRVHTPLGVAVSATSFVVGTLPRFDSFSPTSGRPGDIVALNGANLNAVTRVRFGNVPVPAISRPSNQQITLTVPPGVVTAPIFLDSDAGTVQGPGVFTVLSPAATTVSSINPTSGRSGFAVAVNGTGLLRVTGVFFAPGIPADAFGAESDTLLRAFPPAGAVTGPIRLDTPTGPVFTPVFTIIADAKPTVSVANPAAGAQFNGGQVISVDWFAGDDGTIVSQDIRYSPDGGSTFQTLAPGVPGNVRSQLVQLPTPATSNALISVTARDNIGQVGEGRSGIFRVLGDAPPRVTVLVPNGGELLTAGQTVEIQWDSSDDVGLASHDVRFSPDGGATFQPIATGIPGFRRAVQWTVPGQPTDRALVSVIARDTAGRTAEDRSNALFRIQLAAPAPVITSVDPGQGRLAGGTAVTVRGAAFVPGARVRIGGSDAATTYVSDVQLNAVTPAGAAPGPVQVVVVNPDGQRAVLEGGFTYLAPAGVPVSARLVLVSATVVDPVPDPAPGVPEEDAFEPDGTALAAAPAPAGPGSPAAELLPATDPALSAVAMPIQIKAGTEMTLEVFAELVDAEGRPVFDREVSITFDPRTVPPNCTLEVLNPVVLAFGRVFSKLTTSVDTPTGFYRLIFGGQTVLPPTLFTPLLPVDIEITAPTRKVALFVTPPRQTVAPGGRAPFDVRLDRKNLRDVPVRLLVKNALPPGVSVTFDPPRPTLRTATMFVQTPPDIGAGDIRIVVTGRTNVMGSKVVNADPVFVAVQPAAQQSVQLVAQTAEQRVAAGGTAQYALALARTGLAGQAVRLEVDPATLPAGATATFEPAAPTGDTAVLRVATTAQTPAGTSTLALRGAVDVPGATVAGTSVRLVVDAPAARAVKLSVSPASAVARPGLGIKFAVALDRTGADDVLVRLRATGTLPAGTTYAFTPASTTTTRATLLVTLPATAPAGSYTFTVSGTTATAGVAIAPSAPVAVRVDRLAAPPTGTVPVE